MKIITLISVICFLGFSCKKETPIKNICAACEELKTHTKPADYCGTQDAVNAYVTQLKEIGKQYGQIWECSVK